MSGCKSLLDQIAMFASRAGVSSPFRIIFFGFTEVLKSESQLARCRRMIIGRCDGNTTSWLCSMAMLGIECLYYPAPALRCPKASCAPPRDEAKPPGWDGSLNEPGAAARRLEHFLRYGRRPARWIAPRTI